MKKYASFFLLCLLYRLPLFAHTGFEFLRTDLGPRAAGMAGGFTAVEGDVTGLIYNPASLASQTQSQLSFVFVNHLLDFQSGVLAWSGPWKKNSILGASLSYMNYGEFEWTDESGTPTGSSAPEDIVLSLGYGWKFSPQVRLGASIRYMHSTIENYHASALSSNLGMIYYIPKEQLTFGFAIWNWGKALSSFREHKEKVPTAIRIGFSKRLAHLPFMLVGDVYQFTPIKKFDLKKVYWIIGGEFTASEHVLVRFGYNSRGKENKLGPSASRLTGLSFGGGLVLKNFRLDYGQMDYGMLGNVHQFGVTWVF